MKQLFLLISFGTTLPIFGIIPPSLLHYVPSSISKNAATTNLLTSYTPTLFSICLAGTTLWWGARTISNYFYSAELNKIQKEMKKQGSANTNQFQQLSHKLELLKEAQHQELQQGLKLTHKLHLKTQHTIRKEHQKTQACVQLAAQIISNNVTTMHNDLSLQLDNLLACQGEQKKTLNILHEQSQITQQLINGLDTRLKDLHKGQEALRKEVHESTQQILANQEKMIENQAWLAKNFIGLGKILKSFFTPTHLLQ